MSGATTTLQGATTEVFGDVLSSEGYRVTDYLGLTDTAADVAAAAEAQKALDTQKEELEADRIKREEEIQKEIEKRNASRERVLSRGRGYGGTILTSGLDSSTLNVKKKKLGVG